MKKQILFKSNVGSGILNELLEKYATSNLTANSTYKDYESVAIKFIKNLDKLSIQSFLEEEFIADGNSFAFPKGFSNLEKQDFVIGFENLYYTVKNRLNEYEPSSIELITERQASPPAEVYDLVGHNADINVKKMSYSYLYD